MLSLITVENNNTVYSIERNTNEAANKGYEKSLCYAKSALPLDKHLYIMKCQEQVPTLGIAALSARPPCPRWGKIKAL